MLTKLIQEGFTRIVSTTTRECRSGEKEGVDYFYISEGESNEMELNGEFAELVTFLGVRYGVTNQEMAGKMSQDTPPVVILEPSGLEMYKHYCNAHGYGIYSIYVHTPEDTRITRIKQRAYNDLTFGKANFKTVDVLASRIISAVGVERTWISQHKYDLIVDGTNEQKALQDIYLGIEQRNKRQSIYS
jgi:guanylate kinase